MKATILEKLKALIEAKVDDEYSRNYSSIDRDIFDSIVLMDPQTKEVNGEVDKLGFASKSLLLRCYMNGETDFISEPDRVRDALTAYYPNISKYPKFPQFKSIADFLAFMENPDNADVDVVEIKKENKIDTIYNKNYNKIDRGLFDELIALDPETNVEKGKLGNIAQQIILRDALKGIDISTISAEVITRACEAYYEDKQKLPNDKQVLSSYESLAAFVKYILEGPDSALWTSIKNNPAIPTDTVRLVASTRDYDIFEPKSHAANNAISGGNNHMRWCTGYDNNDTYWTRYTSNNARLFCFMHKTRNRGTENRDVNWQIQVRNNDVIEFLNGHDQAAFVGKTKAERFKSFLLSYPDILYAIKDKEPFNAVIPVQQAVELLSLKREPFMLTKETAYKIQADPQLAILIHHLIVDMEKIPTALCANFVSLDTIEFKEGLKEIGAQAFKNCPKITTLIFPESLVEIGDEAFANDIALKGSIRLPNNLRTIKTKAFLNTRCKLKIDINRDKKINFAKVDEPWVKSHVEGIKVQADNI